MCQGGAKVGQQQATVQNIVEVSQVAVPITAGAEKLAANPGATASGGEGRNNNSAAATGSRDPVSSSASGNVARPVTTRNAVLAAVAAAAGVFSIGEVLDGNPDYLTGYAAVLPRLLNYAIYGPLRAFYQQRGPSQALVDAHDAIGSRVRDAAALGTFLDNHDNPRWLSTHGDAALLRNALAYVLLARGIPVLYYGTEQAFAGGADPANREDLWRSGFGAGDLYRFIARLASVRRAAAGLPGDDHRHLLVENTAYAWSRTGGDVVVLMSNVGSRTSRRYCLDTRGPGGRGGAPLGGGGVRGGCGRPPVRQCGQRRAGYSR